VSAFDFSWWDAVFVGRPADVLERVELVKRELLRRDADPPNTPDERSHQEVRALAVAFDPASEAFRTFGLTMLSLARSGLLLIEDVPRVAERAAELVLAQRSWAYVPTDEPHALREAWDAYFRDGLEAAVMDRYDEWIAEQHANEGGSET
jgi:hypothetical protein